MTGLHIPAHSAACFGDMVHNINERILPEDAEGLSYVGLEHLDPESLKIRRWGTPDEVEAQKLRFYAGDIIFGKRRYYQKKLAVADFDGICSAHAMVLRARPEVVLPEFLPFFMQSEMFFERAMAISVGSLSPTINWSTLAKQEFSLPPLDEQRRSAEILWAVEDIVENLLIAKTELETLRKALMRDVFDLEHLAHNDRIFKMCRLGDVIEYASDGPFGSKLKTEHYASSGARVIRLQNIGERFFDDEDKAFISLSHFHGDLSGYAVYPNDILIAGLGDESNAVGRTCIAPDYLGPAVNKADCFCVRTDKAVLDPSYLVYLLNSTYGKEQILRLTQGTTRLRINVSNLKTIPIPLPSLEFQSAIAERFQFIDTQQVELNKHIERTKMLGKQLREELLGKVIIGKTI